MKNNLMSHFIAYSPKFSQLNQYKLGILRKTQVKLCQFPTPSPDDHQDTLDAKLAFIGHDILPRSIAKKKEKKGTKTIFERAAERINGRGEIGILKIRLVSS